MSLKYRELYQRGKHFLEKAELESPAFDALCLFEKWFGMDRAGLVLHGEEVPEEGRSAGFLRQIQQRAGHTPLQYLLGTWEFLDLELEVGKGVLVPRAETELLVETAAEYFLGRRKETMEKPAFRAVDLCAGTGAVGLGLAGMVPDLEITAVEWYEEAYGYLQRNIRKTGRAVAAFRGDVLSPDTAGQFSRLDAVISNPPYVRTGQIPELQPEVQQEPSTALDGGEDGLLFYRAIAGMWISRLNPGGLCCVEIGEEQGDAVAALFRQAGLLQVEIRKDFSGLDRVVRGIRP